MRRSPPLCCCTDCRGPSKHLPVRGAHPTLASSLPQALIWDHALPRPQGGRLALRCAMPREAAPAGRVPYGTGTAQLGDAEIDEAGKALSREGASPQDAAPAPGISELLLSASRSPAARELHGQPPRAESSSLPRPPLKASCYKSPRGCTRCVRPSANLFFLWQKLHQCACVHARVHMHQGPIRGLTPFSRAPA